MPLGVSGRTGAVDVATLSDESRRVERRTAGPRRSGGRTAVWALVLLGAVSGSALVLPEVSPAQAQGPMRTTGSTASALSCSPSDPRAIRKAWRAASAHQKHDLIQGFRTWLALATTNLPQPVPSQSAQTEAPQPAASTAAPRPAGVPSPTGTATPSEIPTPPVASPTPIATESATSAPSSTPAPSPSPSNDGGGGGGGGGASTSPLSWIGNLRTVLSGGTSRLDAGMYTFDDFVPLASSDNFLGINTTGDLVGAGRDRTVLEMKAHSSSRAGNVPTAKGTTNQLSLIKISGARTVRDFTLQGTDQGHLYNGLRIANSKGAQISNVRVVAVPGNKDVPPGETFGINDGRTTSSHYSNIDIDGKHVSASNFAANSSNDVVIDDSSFRDAGYSHGAAFWQTHDITVRDTSATGNHRAGFNFERVSGTVNMIRTTTKDNALADYRIASDQGSAVYNIVDPVFSGPKLRIMIEKTVFGVPETQKRSDIHVIINGVDRTNDVVEWTTR
jgi:hypothetical protein